MARREPTTALVLRTPEPDWDLDGYEFTDAEHAKSWMAQSFVKGTGYKVVRVKLVPCNCPECPRRRHPEVPWLHKRSENA